MLAVVQDEAGLNSPVAHDLGGIGRKPGSAEVSARDSRTTSIAASRRRERVYDARKYMRRSVLPKVGVPTDSRVFEVCLLGWRCCVGKMGLLLPLALLVALWLLLFLVLLLLVLVMALLQLGLLPALLPAVLLVFRLILLRDTPVVLLPLF